MDVVRDMEDFRQVRNDSCTSDVLTAEEYAARLSP
jgi:hypothetical protein